MKIINWNAEKSLSLKESRGVCFEDVVFYIERGQVLDDFEHPNQEDYPGQRIMILDIGGYAYLVPYVENDAELFLKTIIPSRKQRKNTSEIKMKAKLTKEEKTILESFERDEWIPVKNLAKRKKVLSEYTRDTLRKDKRLNIRISERDLIELQRKAVREGLPYQTYVSSIIHKFINGSLVEVNK